MATSIPMPQLGESVTEGTIGRWLKAVGESVDRDEPLVEIITDKVNVEIPSPAAGILTRIAAAEGQTVPVGVEIAELDGDPAAGGPTAEEHTSSRREAAGARGATLSAVPAPPAVTAHSGSVALAVLEGPSAPTPVAPRSAAWSEPPNNDDQPRTSPLVRRLAREHGLDLAQIKGSGLGGRVTRDDVHALLQSAAAGAALVASAPPTEPARAAVAVAPPPVAATARPTPRSAQVRPPAESEGWRALSAQRRAIAEHMLKAVSTQPHVTLCVDVDVTGVAKARDAAQADFQRREGFELTYLPFMARAVVDALREHPTLNAAYRENDRGEPGLVVHRQINLGIAVALEDGLIVPVIRDADALSVAGLARAVRDLAVRARSGKLMLDDVRGGTFTLNNTGVLGSVKSNPIINGGQAGIITMEAVVRRPVVVCRDGEETIAIRSIMGSCLTFDHRILDGLPAGRFMQTVKRRLEAIGPNLALY